MKKLSLVAALLAAVAVLSSSCGSDASNASNAPDGGSGVSRSSTVGSLDGADAARLCDWSNQRQGGYGRTVTCTGGDQSTDASQAECTAAVPAIAAQCPTLTVGDVEDCTNAVGTALCSYTTASACAALRACLGD